MFDTVSSYPYQPSNKKDPFRLTPSTARSEFKSQFVSKYEAPSALPLGVASQPAQPLSKGSSYSSNLPNLDYDPCLPGVDLSKSQLLESLVNQDDRVISFGDSGPLVSYVNGVKVLSCPFCSYSSVNHAANVRKHMLTHTNHKPYACKFCSYRSTQKSNVKTHIIHNHSNMI